MHIIVFSEWFDSVTAFWIFFWRFAFDFFNTISTVIFSGFLPTNKPVLLISCRALTFSSVSSPAVLSAVATAAASCPSEAAAVPCLVSARGVTVSAAPEAQPQYVPVLSHFPAAFHLLWSDPIISNR